MEIESTLNPQIIDDESSWSSLSDNAQKPKPFENKQKKTIKKKQETLNPPESSNERMKKFDVTYESTQKLQLIGSLINITKKYLLIKSINNKNIMKLDNILFYKNNDIKILGKIQDVIGSIEEPIYVVEFDNYLKNFSQELISNLGVYINLEVSDFFGKNEIEDMIDENGTDASYQNDKEYKDFDEDFSDDEVEKNFLEKNKTGFLKKRDLDFLNDNFAGQSFSLKKLMGKDNKFISKPFFNQGGLKNEGRKPVKNSFFLENNNLDRKYTLKNPFSQNNIEKDTDFQDFKIKKKHL